jgi:hypothetical protein
MNGSAEQLAERSRRHAGQAPHEIWKGTLTRSPGATVSTESPTSTTSATHSWPIGKGGANGELPSMISASRSQVATASGRTSAASSELSFGSGASRHWSAFAAVNVS